MPPHAFEPEAAFDVNAIPADDAPPQRELPPPEPREEEPVAELLEEEPAKEE